MRYDIYKLSKKEWIKYVVTYMAASAVIAYLFYESFWAFVVLMPFFYFYIKRKKKELKESRISELKEEFIQMILSLSASLVAGFSIENSLKESLSDMKNMYGDDAILVKEIEGMLNRMNNGSRIEEEIADFAERTDAEEIRDFATVFSIAKKGGGKFSDIIKNCVSIMRSERETETEIQILISGKRYEQRIMNFIPFVLLGCLKMTSRELIGVLYHNMFGIVVMTICLLMYVVAIYLAEKISDIRC